MRGFDETPQYVAPENIGRHRERFWASVPNRSLALPEACWTWQGPAIKAVSVFYANGLTFFAHRFAFQLERGPVVGLAIRRSCRVTTCVRPDHLVAGPNLGTPPRLTQQQLNDVRWMMRHGFTPERVAEMYHIHPRHAYALRAADDGESLS